MSPQLKKVCIPADLIVRMIFSPAETHEKSGLIVLNMRKIAIQKLGTHLGRPAL